MHNELNELMDLMNNARLASNKANDQAFEARQRAIKLQFDASGSAEMASLAAEMLATAKDKETISKLAVLSRQAIRQTIQLTEVAATAVEKANAFDQIVTSSFEKCREAASRLLEALDKLEADL
ncbi:hypothetical protein ACFSR7_00585 [Cohnella sp. GCM10020058]|uniref:hypothetical protein n=1 Tax=Cohnella sp. GCM10020058 TaxID=3317330 RepID=UPI00363E2250